LWIKDKLACLVTKKITREKLDLFLKKHSTGGKTLDIGCGNVPYVSYFPNSVTIDVSRLRKPAILADAHCLPFGNESFDVILCTEVLEHLKEPQWAIDEMERVLLDGGKVVLTTRFIFPLHDTPDDYYRFTKYGLRYLLRNWRIVEIKEETSTLGSIAVLFQRMGFQSNFRVPLLEIFPYIVARFLLWLDFIARFLIREEYGVFYEKIPEKGIMTSGYYVIAEKCKTQKEEGKS
jgi:SAM-dependent methyltransferase